jgi:hypothetical protein
VKKILSILLALGVILGLTITAVPVAAQVVCPDDCSGFDLFDADGPPDFCAGGSSWYWIGFPTSIVLPVTLIPGTDSLSVEFPAGTDLSNVDAIDVDVWDWSATLVGPFNPTAVTIDGERLEFVIPAGFLPDLLDTGDLIEIDVDDVINTDNEGLNCLFVNYKLACCDPEVFDCVEFTVLPAIHTLDFVFDFDKTYTGIAEDFIPPFKACGQDGYGAIDPFGLPPVGWMSIFDLILTADPEGCAPPCDDAEFWFVLEDCPPDETITFYFDMLGVLGGPYLYTLTDDDIGDKQALPSVDLTGIPWVDRSWENYIHFSSPGKDYNICFYLECPAVTCGPGSKMVAEACMPCKVYQWKDALKIPLYRKWNLISLPLVPLVDPPVEDTMGAYAYFDTDVLSIWYYDRCNQDWLVYPAGYPGGDAELKTMEDGKSYWIRIKYDAANPPGTALDGLWTWGTPKPVPPLSPSSYEVCEGWNMVGFTETDPLLLPMWDNTYLWNWVGFAGNPEYSGVYGWDPANLAYGTQVWWSYPAYWGTMPWVYQGEGYWISFERDGFIYPP